MKKCLVSMVSDQTIPNILITTAIKPDHLLLVSTEAMEQKNKSNAILDSLSIFGMDYKDKSHKLMVSENSIPDFNEKVMEWFRKNGKDYQFVVNLTGGTKLMSIAAYDFFKNFNAEMIYMPIPKNFYFSVHKPGKIVSVSERLSISAYLAAYDVSICNFKKISGMKQEARERKDTTCFIFENYKKLEPLLKRMGSVLRNQQEDAVRRRGLDFSIEFKIELPVEMAFLDKMGFECEGGFIKKKIDYSNWNYLRGGWLEERIFLAFEAILPYSSDICLNAICEVNGNRNEYDVLAIYENILYVVECKSLQVREGSDVVRGGEINDFLYKLGALRQVFGLTPRPLLVTTSEDVLKNGEIKSNLIERSKLFNSQIIPLWQIDNIEKWLKENVFNL